MTLEEMSERLQALEKAVKELQNATTVQGRLEATLDRRSQEHAEWLRQHQENIKSHERWLMDFQSALERERSEREREREERKLAMKEHDLAMKDLDRRIRDLVSGFGEFMNQMRARNPLQ